MVLTQAIIDAVRATYPDAFHLSLNGFKDGEKATKWYVTFYRASFPTGDTLYPGAMMVSV